MNSFSISLILSSRTSAINLLKMYWAYEKRGQTFQNSDLTYLKVVCLVNQTVIESNSPGTARFTRPANFKVRREIRVCIKDYEKVDNDFFCLNSIFILSWESLEKYREILTMYRRTLIIPNTIPRHDYFCDIVRAIKSLIVHLHDHYTRYPGK